MKFYLPELSMILQSAKKMAMVSFLYLCLIYQCQSSARVLPQR